MKIICHSCGMPIALTKVLDLPVNKRLAKLALIDVKNCGNCGIVPKKVIKTLDDNFTFRIDTPDGQVLLQPSEIRQWFERITQSTLDDLGVIKSAHPRHLIIENMPVPPVALRPSNSKDTVGVEEVNIFLQNIIKRNIVSNDERTLINSQNLYYNLIKDSSSSSSKRSIIIGSGNNVSIASRLPSKEGRMRKNLHGKRTTAIARATISGNNDMPIDSVGVPIKFARILQSQEVVQTYNKSRLMQYFLNGIDTYPGATKVFKKNTNAMYKITSASNFQLEIGDIIYRDIITGDLAYFNRQPSLEKSSIGVHKVIILNDPKVNTFQINVAACAWYNADFDGDQMNLWVTSGIMSTAEAGILSKVSNGFISIKDSGPVIGQVQDSTLGLFLLTQEGRQMNRQHAMGLLRNTRITLDFSNIPKQLSGKDVASIYLRTLPINYSRRTKWYSDVFEPYMKYNPNDIKCVIEDGVIISGVLDKISIGAGAMNGVHHLIARQYSYDKALESVFDLQQMALSTIDNVGFTVSANDIRLPTNGVKEIHKIINRILRKSQEIDDTLINNEIIPPIGVTTREYYEQLQLNTLTMPDELIGTVINNISPETNGLFRMVGAGSKGSTPNLLHIIASIGQVTINMRRIPYQFAMGRTSVYYPKFSLSADSRGFIANSYVEGLTSAEYDFGSRNGRNDLINKALSTASTGYLNRKSIFALQSNIVNYFRGVSIDKKIVQFIYGNDGIDPRFVEQVDFKLMTATWSSYLQHSYRKHQN